MTVVADRVGAYTIEQVDVRTASDDELRPIAELQQKWLGESVPEDPMLPLDVLIRNWRSLPKEVIRKDWVVRTSKGQLVARGMLTRFDAPDNQHIREISAHVDPQHRRRGIGRALFERVVNAAAAQRDDILFLLRSNSRVPAGIAFIERIRAEEGLSNRTSQMELGALDRAMVREWASIDPKGYRLEWIDEDVPDQLMQNVIVAYDTMNTAPRDNLKVEDWKTTDKLVRSFEASRKAAGRQHRLLLAIHEESGETAGFTEVEYDERVPHVIHQDGTAVIPAHRGHGIGKWIKALMIERVTPEWPQAKYIRTGNAYSNAPMLSINDRLGFKVVWSSVHWQLPLAKAKEYLAGR